MTDDTGAGQRSPESTMAPLHGHRKLTSAGGTLLVGATGGQQAIIYVWDSMVTVLNWWVGIPLDPMPEKVAADIIALLAMMAFYQTEERQ